MNPFLWLIWGLGASVVLFVSAAGLSVAYKGVRDIVRGNPPCPHCGQKPGDKATYVPPTWTDDGA